MPWNGMEPLLGLYVVEPAADSVPSLSPDEETGIERALESYRQGRIVDTARA